jgi:hypothetical protein
MMMRMMRKIRLVLVIGAALTMLPATAAHAASPVASCPGQELSTLAPLLGSDLGAFLAFEARNPELEGRKSFGEEISEFAHADRTVCPEE